MTTHEPPSEIACVADKRPSLALTLRLARTAVILILLATTVSAINVQSTKVSGISFLWLSNGLLTGVLLCTPRRHWGFFLGLGFSVDLGVNHLHGSGWAECAIFASINIVEVVLASTFAYKAIAPTPDLTEPRQIRSFLFYCVFFAPAVTASLAVLYLHSAYVSPLLTSYRLWFAADALGMATVVPLYLSFHFGTQFSRRSPLEQLLLFALLGSVALFCFRYTHLPTLWLVLFVLMLLGVRLGFTASAAGLLLVTFIGGYFTVEGFGPLAITSSASGATMILLLQSFIVLSMLVLYCTEVSMSATRRSQARLQASEARFRSLAETSSDIIILTDLEGRREYVSPASREVLGFQPAQLLGRPFNDLVHPEDLAPLDQLFADLLAARTAKPVAFRSVRADGSHRWVETTASLLLHHATALPDGFVYVLRDIADRKDAEQRLLAAFADAEKLALVDGLTGVANRREFDRTLERAWRRATRDKTPLSLLMIDVDCFKRFNDLYGHLAGDECLRVVATIASSAFNRMTDVLARYGGEEFAGILPNTLSEDACTLAERIRSRVEDRQIPHLGSESKIVTISLGVATIRPKVGATRNDLVEAADAALYRAKRTGRNRAELAHPALVPVP